MNEAPPCLLYVLCKTIYCYQGRIVVRMRAADGTKPKSANVFFESSSAKVFLRHFNIYKRIKHEV
jgi:hypothetical protein